MVGWSVGRLVGWSVGRLVGWSVGRLVGWSVGRWPFCPDALPLAGPGSADMVIQVHGVGRGGRIVI